jgi:carboxypeptidase C (cathepsin A)
VVVSAGFSYADSPLDYETTEEVIAQDLYVFMQNFFLLFPQYSRLPFYIMGESVCPFTSGLCSVK